jgi:5'-nucleotidase / UDP-sugar diphosphatase
MKKGLSLLAIVFFVPGFVCPLHSEEIVILHSNDTHGIYKPYRLKVDGIERSVGGMEAASHHINAIRARAANVLLIDKGDLLTGTLATEIEHRGTAGGVMIEFLNRLGYDIWCYGNHDFDKGQENAVALSRLAEFPTVMANIVHRENGRLFAADPYRLFDVGKVKVGVIAVMQENFLTEVQKTKVDGLAVLPILPTLQAYVPVLGRQADLVIVLYHGRFDQAVEIAKNVPGVDVVLSASEDGRFEDVNGVPVQSTYGHQRTLGYVKIEVDEGRVIRYERDLIWLWADGAMTASPCVLELIGDIEASVGTEFAKIIGRAETDFIVRDHRIKNAHAESALGNWITDAMRWKTGVPIAFHNTGAIRAGIPAGPVTRAEVFGVAPFHNHLVIFDLTGAQIKDLLEFDVERGWDRLQVSGLKYRHLSRGAEPYGARVNFLEVNGEVVVKNGKLLLPDKRYAVVSNDYLVGHAKEKYFGFAVDAPRDTGFPLDITLMEWLEEFKVIDHRIEGRIVQIR